MAQTNSHFKLILKAFQDLYYKLMLYKMNRDALFPF